MRYRIALVFAAGCVSTDTSPCAGELCRADTVCAIVPVPASPDLEAEDRAYCVLPAQLSVCLNAADGVACTVDLLIDTGTCHAGVCLDNECGNRLVDEPEACDDGNTRSADQCSSDCRSDETCGNGTVDVAAGEACDDHNLVGHDGCAATCETESARWSDEAYAPPTPRSHYGFVFDHVRHRGVMFGGEGDVLGQFAADTQEWDGLRWHPTATGLAPLPRAQHGMAYDGDRRVAVLFGGTNGTVFDDTWEWDGAHWNQRTAVVNAPARRNAAMAYDPIRKRVVMFGGSTQAGVELADTWTWDGATWSPLPGLQPTARHGAAMAFDPTSGTIVMHGGTAPGMYFDDMWELGPTGWGERSQNGARPEGRFDHALTFDVVERKLVMAGGTLRFLGDSNEIWSFADGGWTRFDVDLPSRSSGFELLTDPILGALYFWEPFSPDFATDSAGSLHVWTGYGWKAVDDRSPLQYIVSRQAFVAEPSRHRVVMFGGKEVCTEANCTPPGAVIDSSKTIAWNGRLRGLASATPGPSRRYGAAMAATASDVILFGGQGSATFGDTWRLVDQNWTELGILGPPPRSGHVMAHDPVNQTSVLFGGARAGTTYGDTWTFDGSAWTAVTAPGPGPQARTQAAMAYHPRRGTVVLFGGLGTTSALNDTWEWNGTTRAWDAVEVSGLVPPLRYGASLAYDAATSRLVLVGGRVGPAGADSIATDVWEASWEGDVMTWRQLATSGAFPARADFALVSGIDGFGVLALGGDVVGPSGTVRPRGDVWLLSWSGGSRYEACTDQDGDNDGDGVSGCADLDCWKVCTPLCPPGAIACPATGTCGDNLQGAFETCFMCPEDVGPCRPRCGNFTCDPAETAASCPGDCP